LSSTSSSSGAIVSETPHTGTEPRLAAHERLSTGALAWWTRACANHPWRVIGIWVLIVATLIFLVSTVGGSLRDKFEIPGSDTQKATDLIKAEFASEQGAVLNIVFAAPAGERLDTPERKAAIESAITKLGTPEFSAAKGGRSSPASVIRSVPRPSRRTAGSPTPRRSSTRRSRTRTATASSRCRTRFGGPLRPSE